MLKEEAHREIRTGDREQKTRQGRATGKANETFREQIIYTANAISPIRTYFTRWLIRANSYDLTRTILCLGAELGVGHSYKFIRIGNS